MGNHLECKMHRAATPDGQRTAIGRTQLWHRLCHAALDHAALDDAVDRKMGWKSAQDHSSSSCSSRVGRRKALSPSDGVYGVSFRLATTKCGLAGWPGSNVVAIRPRDYYADHVDASRVLAAAIRAFSVALPCVRCLYLMLHSVGIVC